MHNHLFNIIVETLDGFYLSLIPCGPVIFCDDVGFLSGLGFLTLDFTKLEVAMVSEFFIPLKA